MKPLTSLLCVLLLRASCRAFNDTDLFYLRDLWLDAVKKSNQSFLRQLLHEDDFQQLIYVLSNLRTSENRWNIFQDIKAVIVKNSYKEIYGKKIRMLTNFCGPGDVSGPSNETVCGLFNGVDECCKAHDSCDTYITSKSDYDDYPNLSWKALYFTSLRNKFNYRRTHLGNLQRRSNELLLSSFWGGKVCKIWWVSETL